MKLRSQVSFGKEYRMKRESIFQDVIDKMPRYMEELEDCRAMGMYTMADRRSLRRQLPASKGVYVLYERERPMYVGRSDNLAARLLEHGRPSGGSETATFAFNIAKDEFPGSASISRNGLQGTKEFKPLFDAAKERVRKMALRVVDVEDPIEQTILEVYAHLALRTQFNSFDNH